MKSVNGLTGIKSTVTPQYGGTKVIIPFYADISDIKDAQNLYELFEQRSRNNSTIFVGQYPVDEIES